MFALLYFFGLITQQIKPIRQLCNVIIYSLDEILRCDDICAELKVALKNALFVRSPLRKRLEISPQQEDYAFINRLQGPVVAQEVEKDEFRNNYQQNLEPDFPGTSAQLSVSTL